MIDRVPRRKDSGAHVKAWLQDEILEYVAYAKEHGVDKARNSELEVDAMITGYEKPLYILPFDHRHRYITGVFHWQEPLTPGQAADIVARKR